MSSVCDHRWKNDFCLSCGQRKPSLSNTFQSKTDQELELQNLRIEIEIVKRQIQQAENDMYDHQKSNTSTPKEMFEEAERYGMEFDDDEEFEKEKQFQFQLLKQHKQALLKQKQQEVDALRLQKEMREIRHKKH
jgi:hypothetical protein